ncbi:MAG: hypothetical protein ACK5P4_04060 [Bacteroidota bacterium]|jgi:hypothetical protein
MAYFFDKGDPIKAIDIGINRECGFLPEDSRGHILLIKDNLVSFRISTGGRGGKVIEAHCSTEVFSTYFALRRDGVFCKDFKTTHYLKLYPNEFRR